MSAWEAAGKSDEWYTPRYVFDALGCRFDLDVANSDPTFRHVPCTAAYAADGLLQPWFGFVWMNPPFGGRNSKAPWLQRFVDHRNGIALMPDRTSAPWFHQFIRHFDAVLFVQGKIKFENAAGVLGEQPGNGTMLAACGRLGEQALLRAAVNGLGWVCKGHSRREVSLL